MIQKQRHLPGFVLGFLLAGFAVVFLQSAAAVPIYTDTSRWVDNEITPDNQVQQRTMQLNRLIDHIHRTYRLPRQVTIDIVTEVALNAREYDLQPELLLAIIAVESTFRDDAVSPVGALGLMQVLPSAHPEKIDEIGGVEALFDPRKNIATGTLILQEYLNLSRGNLRRALLRYNGSLGIPGSPYANRVLDHYRTFRNVAQVDELS